MALWCVFIAWAAVLAGEDEMMTGLFILFGGMLLFVSIIGTLDLIGRRHAARTAQDSPVPRVSRERRSQLKTREL
jgi:nitrate reductase gamma subunit